VFSPPRRPSAAVLAAAALALTAGAAPASAATPASVSYTISTSALGSYGQPDDTPANGYIDKDGTFYYQESHSLYGAKQGRQWSFYTGTDFDSATWSSTLSNAVNPANRNDSNGDTTWRCNNSPTGLSASYDPDTSSYSQRNFCDLSSVWVDPDTGNWYGLVHNEFSPQPFGDGVHFDAIDYAVSTDQGRTWTIKDHVITSPYSTTRGDANAFPNQTYYYGDGDQRLLVDPASGYFYVFYGSRVVDKNGGWSAFYEHAARAPISGKMAPDTWQKWYDGSWSQPGTGGLESDMVPAGTSNTNGYTPVANEYNPADPGTGSQQVAAGTMPATSPLFAMDVTYDAYLGLYVGEPQAVDQSGNAPQQYYVTNDLSSQKWYLAGDTGSYHTASWYRWFLDSANRTSSQIVGKDFRSYCAYSCSNGSSSEYVNVTIDSSTPVAAPVDLTEAYRISNADGRVLAQASGGSATTSLAAATGSGLESWVFSANGDGSYRIANAATGQLLGVDSGSTANRAWGTAPTVTAAGSGGPTVGQQWFIIAGTTGSNAATGTFRLVNRYSGLVIGLSADSSRPAETTPTRTWSNTTGNAVGGTRTANEQTLGLTATGPATGPANLNGTHTLSISGQALDDPNWSTTGGTQLDTWSVNGGQNQSWTFTQQPDGSYTIVNAYSKLCADDNGGFTTPGTAVIEWTCSGGANQEWNVTQLASGAYTITNVHTGLLLTTASTADGALVTQQAGTGGSLQQWTIS
jgi:hypothetical protein